MAEAATLARPYARAAFDLAREEKRLAEWSALLSGLAAAVRDPKLAMWIGHPAIGRAQLADVIIDAYGKGLSDTDKNLLRLLAEYNRLKLAPAISEQFELLKAEAEKRIEVEVVSAAPVDPAQQKALADAIRKRLNRDVEIEWKTDPELLGGARIRAGDLVIDHTIVGELEQLRTALTA